MSGCGVWLWVRCRLRAFHLISSFPSPPLLFSPPPQVPHQIPERYQHLETVRHLFSRGDKAGSHTIQVLRIPESVVVDRWGAGGGDGRE